YLNRLAPMAEVIPVGAVGGDSEGDVVLAELASERISTEHVRTMSEASTLFSVSFVYPDRSGGNLTDAASASARVAVGDVNAALAQTRSQTLAGRSDDGWGGAVVALPEVGLDARRALLRGASPGTLRVASFVSTELAAISARDWCGDIDLLVVNWDEACALGRDARLTPSGLPGLLT